MGGGLLLAPAAVVNSATTATVVLGHIKNTTDKKIGAVDNKVGALDTLVKNEAKGTAKSLGQLGKLVAETNQITTQALAVNNARVATDSSEYIVDAVHSAPAYVGRLGFTKEEIERTRAWCYEGLANRVGGPERVYLFEDGSAGTATIKMADTNAMAALEYRRSEGTPGHASVLDSIPDSIRTGQIYADGTAISHDDLDFVSESVWLLHPGEPAGDNKADAYAYQLRYGLANQVFGTFYAGLRPLISGNAEGQDIFDRYPPELLPVAKGEEAGEGTGNRHLAVPGYAVLRAAAIGPWAGVSPEDPQDISKTYAGWLLKQNSAGLSREIIKLLTVNNRLLYENIIWQRYSALLLAQADLRDPS